MRLDDQEIDRAAGIFVAGRKGRRGGKWRDEGQGAGSRERFQHAAAAIGLAENGTGHEILRRNLGWPALSFVAGGTGPAHVLLPASCVRILG
ncbi:hypothetical protein D3C71_1925040 [compost metagenome]